MVEHSEETNKSEKKRKQKDISRSRISRYFIEKLADISTGLKGKDCIPALLQTLRFGFQNETHEGHIEKVRQILFSKPDFSRLALKVVLESLSRTPPVLFRLLAQPIRKEMASRSGFPVDKIPPTASAPDPQRRRVLQAWIRRHVHDGRLDPEWGRQALACILDRKVDDDTLTAIHEILQLSSGKPLHAEPGSFRTVYLRRIGALFSTKKFPKTKVLFGLELAGFLQDRCNNLEKSFADLEENLDTERNQSRTLRRDLSAAHQSLNEMQSQIMALAMELKEKENLLVAEKKRFATRDLLE